MSMKPGATAQPDASSSRSPRRFGPISWITPPVIATSATRPGAPLPSNPVPPRIARSAGISTSLHSWYEPLEPVDRRSGGSSAVHRHNYSRDLRRAFAGQEEDCVRDVLRRPVALQRLAELDYRVDVVVRYARGNVTRGNAVHANTVL